LKTKAQNWTKKMIYYLFSKIQFKNVYSKLKTLEYELGADLEPKQKPDAYDPGCHKTHSYQKTP